MRVAFYGPSQARCGVCVTSTLFAYGLSQLSYGFTWATNACPSQRAVQYDPLISGVKRILRFRRPDTEYAPVNEKWMDLKCSEEMRDAPLGSGDVLLLDYSASVILPATANYVTKAAKIADVSVGVRLHSQLLQQLSLDYVDTMFLPFPRDEAEGLRDNELPTGRRYVTVPHPSAPRVQVDVERDLVIGLGSSQRMPHAFVAECAAEVGARYEAIDGSGGWTGIEELVRSLSRAAVIVLYYGPITGVGRSSALQVALAAGRPIVCSDCVFLREAERWGGVADEAGLTDAIRRALARGGRASGAQEVWYDGCQPEAVAQQMTSTLIWPG